MREHEHITGLLAILGGASTFLVAHYSELLSAGLSCIGITYTLWRWRREARAAARRSRRYED